MGELGRLMVVGGGRMGEALVAGLLRAGSVAAGDLVVVESDPARRDDLATRHPDVAIVAAIPSTSTPGSAVLAVKPADAEKVARALAVAGVTRVLSIAAGVTIGALESWLDTPDNAVAPAVVRAMPNTPALVGAGAAAIAGGSSAGPEDMAWAAAVLEAVGSVEPLPEAALDAVTGLSGSGPAYVFLVAEALIEAGVHAGLDRAVAERLVTQTLLGSARLLAETGDGPAALRAAVTSPGGTTAAGLRVLDARGVRDAIVEAVAAATERSRELGAGA